LPPWFERERNKRAREVADRKEERLRQEAEEKRLRAAARKKAEEDKSVQDDMSLRFWIALTRGDATPADVRLRLDSPVSVRAWAQYLGSNTSIKSLDVSSQGLRDDAGLELADALAVNTGLLSMDLSGNLLGPATFAALAEALERNSTLRSLTVDGNPGGVSDGTGVEAMGHSLAMNSTLTSLSVFSCGLREAGGRALATGVESNSSLLRLQVSPVDGVAVEDAVTMRSALRRNQAHLRERLALARAERAAKRRLAAAEAASEAAAASRAKEEAWIQEQRVARAAHFQEMERQEHEAEAAARAERALAAKPWIEQMRAAKAKEASKGKKKSK
jgi:hypothetical protein